MRQAASAVGWYSARRAMVTWMVRVSLGAGIVWMTCLSAFGQLAGLPAGVPVPPAPMAPDVPKITAPAEPAPDSQVYRVRVVDGRNGSILPNAHLRLWYDDAAGPGYVLATDKHGVALMPEPVGLPVRVLISPTDRIDCRKLQESEPAPGYNLQDIAAKGVSAENHCGDTPARSRPGELVIFVRPLRWYEGINRGTP